MPTHDISNPKDKAIIDALLPLFAQRLATIDKPQAGDAVEIWHPEKGLLYRKAHLERDRWNPAGMGWLTVCTEPMVPFCWSNTTKNAVGFEASGGYWRSISPAEQTTFEQIGITKKMFWTWGWRGVCAGGGVYFTVDVPVWKYTSADFY